MVHLARAVFYYSENYERIKDFVTQMEAGGQSLESAPELLQDEELPQQIAFISPHFRILESCITRLEKRLTVVDSLAIIEEVMNSLYSKYEEKMKQVPEKNTGFSNPRSYARVLSRQTSHQVSISDPGIVANFKCAPITFHRC